MSTVADLLHDYQHVIGELRIITGSGGVFNVEVDGEVLFSKKQEGRFPNDGEVVARFRERYARGVEVYPRD